MRFTVIATLFCVMLGTPLHGQQSVVVQVKAELEAQGVNLLGPCGAFEITKRVAWLKRHEGYGLLGGKNPAQNGCTVGPERYSVDWILKSNGDGVDLLGNAGGNPNNPSEPPNVPTWNEEIADPVLYRPAIDPGGALPTPAPVPIPTPTPTPTPPPSTDLTPILNKLNEIAAQIGKVDQNVTDGRKENQEFYREVGIQWKRVTTFVGKYVAPAIAAYLIGDKVAN